MPDFRTLLNGLAQGHVDSLTDGPWSDMMAGKRRPNAPPPITLSPSQQAFGDMHSGAMSALPSISEMDPSQSMALDPKLRSGVGYLDDAVNRYAPDAIQMRATGGQFDPNQPVIVGENGPEEIVNNTVYPLTGNTDKTYAPGGSVDQRVTGLLDQPPPAQPQVSPTGNDIPNQTAQTPVDTSTRPRVVPVAAPDAETPDPHDTANQYIQTATDNADKATVDTILAQPEKSNKWKNIGIALATSAYNATHPQDIQQVKSWGNFKKDRAIAAAQARAAQIGAIQTGRTAEDQKQAQIDYTLGRNPTALEKIKAAARTAMQNQQIKARREWYLSHRSFHGARATPAEKAELAVFGATPESMGDYDYTDSKVHTVAGKAFKMNPATGQYDAQSVLDNPNEASVAINVTDPHGIDHTYNVPSKEAATIQAGLAKTGMIIKGAADRNAATIAGRQATTDAQINERRSEFLKNYGHKIEQDRKSGVFKAEAEMKKLEEDLKTHKIDQGTHDLMLQVLAKSQ